MQQQKKHKKRRYAHLFFRILVSIGLPLILLLLIFTVLTVRLELERQQEYYNLQARLNYVTLDTQFVGLIESKELLENQALLQRVIKRLQQTLEIKRIDVIDTLKNLSFVTGKEIADVQFEHLQKSLSLRRQGISYYTVVDNKQKTTFGYITVFDKNNNRVIVLLIETPITTLRDALDSVAKIAFSLAILILLTAVFIAIILTHRIIRPVQLINAACRKILGGDLGHQVKVNTGDELQALAANFNRMSRALLLMQRHAADSNPLTKLPGNAKIMAELDYRIKDGAKFVFFHADIDHFKAFNDHYGLKRGDDVLQHTGKLLQTTLLEFEEEGNFVGHQGGDDYILILNPFEAKRIAKKVCDNFDKELRDYYDTEDLERGYFLTKDSRMNDLSTEAKIKKYPLMSISLAGVSNERREFSTHGDVLNAAIIMKKKAKAIPYSNYQLDE